MGDYGGRIKRPEEALPRPEALEEEAPGLSSGVVRAGDMAWIGRRVAQMTSGWAARRAESAVIHRKADGDAKADEGAEVSQPGEPAEKEADAVANKVADELHESDGAK